MDRHQTPQFRRGRSPTLLSTLSQSLSFHASPQSFLAAAHPEDENVPHDSIHAFVRAKILNRDVTVISSYHHCRQILLATSPSSSSGCPAEPVVTTKDRVFTPPGIFTVGPAYRELMVDFFPPPNLLLLDPPAHQNVRQHWEQHMSGVCANIPHLVRDCVVEQFSTWPDGSTIDIYEGMKELSWKLLCSIFLGLPSTSDRFRTVVSLQETVLRGQFSLFPVSINTPFWRSSRSKAVDARKHLQAILKAEMTSSSSDCPFARTSSSSALGHDDLAANALLFTSSIAVKALASLLTASLLNLFLFPSQSSLASQAQARPTDASRDSFLRSILLETERLSPPIIGVMRRVEQDIMLRETAPIETESETSQTVVPAGWDVWLYFVGASRDASVYPRPGQFVPERFMEPGEPEPGFAFGSRGKTCLGQEISRKVVETVVSVMLENGWKLEGDIEHKGIRGWLGWEEDIPVEMIAKDLKQLPSQRPREPIKVRVVH